MYKNYELSLKELEEVFITAECDSLSSSLKNGKGYQQRVVAQKVLYFYVARLNQLHCSFEHYVHIQPARYINFIIELIRYYDHAAGSNITPRVL